MLSKRFIKPQSSLAAGLPSLIRDKVLWLDADDAATLTVSSGLISEWRDKSGLGNDAVQAIGAFQPTYVLAGINGRNIVRFDGIADFIESPDDVSLRMGIGEFGIFVVSVFHTLGAGRVIMKGRTGGTGPTNRRYEIFTTDGVSISTEIDSDTESFKQVDSQTITINTTRASIGGKDNSITDITILTDDTVEQTLDIGTYSTIDEAVPTGLGIGAKPGGGTYLDGDICEAIIIKGRVFAPLEKTLLLSYAAQKWGAS